MGKRDPGSCRVVFVERLADLRMIVGQMYSNSNARNLGKFCGDVEGGIRLGWDRMEYNMRFTSIPWTHQSLR